MIGDVIGIGCGYGAFRIAGMPAPAALSRQVFDWRLVVAPGLSLAATAALKILLNASHPPADATTRIVSVGIITKLPYLVVIEVAVLVVTVQAFSVHRLAGLPYPVWSTARRG